MIFSFIEAYRTQHAIGLMCWVLKVSRSGYYAARVRPPSHREQEDAELTGQIRRIHRDSRGTYGAPRIYARLQAEGVRVGNKRVARLMRKEGLEGCHRRRKKIRTAQRDPRAVPAPDLVERKFMAEAANKLWVADISYSRRCRPVRRSPRPAARTPSTPRQPRRHTQPLRSCS